MTKQRYLSKMYSITAETTSDEIKSIYDHWAQDYEDELVAEHDYAMPSRAAAMAAKRVANKSAKILDIGCGTGLSGVALQNVGFHGLDGCDLSPNMLEIAKSRDIYGRLFEVDLLAPPMQVTEDTYDLSIAVGAFAAGHLGGDAVEEMLRITKPGGTIIITTNDPFYETGILQTKFEALARKQRITSLESEHGDHIPGKNIGGWVFAMLKDS